MRWFEVESTLADDPKIARVLQRFGNAGLGALVRLWGHVASKGSEPGVAAERDGTPFDLAHLAKRAGVSRRYLEALLEFAAEVKHIDPEAWRARRTVIFPAMVRRAAKYQEKRSAGERAEERRLARADRIAARDGRRCCRCGQEHDLELERRIPESDGGGTEDENLQLVCISCGRRRRSERKARDEQRSEQQNRAERYRTHTQDVTESDVLSCTVGTSEIEDPRTHTGLRDASRDSSPGTVQPAAQVQPVAGVKEQGRLPLLTQLHNASAAGRARGSAHNGHAWCGRKCVPGFLHAEFLESIGGEPATAEARVRAFYAAVALSIPAEAAIPDAPLVFWRQQFAMRFGAAEAVKASKPLSAGGFSRFPQDIHNSRTVSTGADQMRRRVADVVRRARR